MQTHTRTPLQTQTPMRAYHGDSAIKRKYLARVRAHGKADQIIKGKYWENGRGCAVGCTIHSDAHAAYETELGIPAAIAHLEDTIFENLPNELALKWPERFLKAIKPGADLHLVVPRFMVWLLIDEQEGVLRFADGKGAAAIKTVTSLYQRLIDGGLVSVNEWAR